MSPAPQPQRSLSSQVGKRKGKKAKRRVGMSEQSIRDESQADDPVAEYLQRLFTIITFEMASGPSTLCLAHTGRAGRHGHVLLPRQHR